MLYVRNSKLAEMWKRTTPKEKLRIFNGALQTAGRADLIARRRERDRQRRASETVRMARFVSPYTFVVAQFYKARIGNQNVSTVGCPALRVVQKYQALALPNPPSAPYSRVERSCLQIVCARMGAQEEL